VKTDFGSVRVVDADMEGWQGCQLVKDPFHAHNISFLARKMSSALAQVAETRGVASVIHKWYR
jgi:hypothetical protein